MGYFFFEDPELQIATPAPPVDGVLAARHLYFLGDGHPSRTCPQDEEGWQEALRAQEEPAGLPQGHKLETRMHTLFLPVIL